MLSFKKNNHYSPKLILRKWETFEENRWGVHVYNLIKNKYEFSTSRGKGAFSFASKNHLYVPMINGQRKSNVEDWFSGIESTFSALIRKVESGKSVSLFNSIHEVMKFLFAVISFKYRNVHELDKVRKKLSVDHDLCSKVSSLPDREINLLIMENMINACHEEYLKYLQFELILFSTKNNKKLIYCDRPFIENAIEGYSFLPITASNFVAIRPTNSDSTYKFEECSDGLIDVINSILAHSSRHWIIADNKILLESFIEESKNNNSEIDAEYKPVVNIKNGYFII